MSGARRSARVASSQGSQQGSSPAAQTSPSRKRKADPGNSPSAKRGKPAPKEQKTIEESMDVDKDDSQAPKPEKEDDKSNGHDETSKTDEKPEPKPEPEKQVETNGQSKEDEATADEKPKTEDNGEEKAEKNGDNQADAANKDEKVAQDDQKKTTTNEDNAVESSAREGEVPSSILEKGILYFVYRGRVNIDDPKEVEDIARSYIVMRPLPHGAKLGDGPIGDDKNCRLLAVPKKTLPVTGNDKWTAFVEKANASFQELKDGFLSGNDYDTATQGPRHNPPITPAAEGVYAITTTGRETHLAYIVTLPSELGQVQHDLGIQQKGSFITSVKNPQAKGPASADLGTDPGYSTEIQNEFRSLRWAPLQPKHLNYESCQFLMIGEGENGMEKATEPQQKDVEKDKTEPKEELEKLEEEDEARVEHLKGDDAIFEDLGTDSKNYPGLQTTW